MARERVADPVACDGELDRRRARAGGRRAEMNRRLRALVQRMDG
jgi:hypothetical protein